MAGTLYAFGCSHTAGHSLKSEITIDFLIKYYREKLGVNDYEELYEKYNERKREKIIYEFNKNFLNSMPDYPENSYAAHLGKLLKLDVKNFAMSGIGIDTVYKQFENQLQNINWDTDVVIVELPPIYRYKSEMGNIMYGMHFRKSARNFMPVIESIEIFYAGVVSLFSKYPVHFVNVMENRHIEIEKYIMVRSINNKTLMDLCKEQNMPRYPSGHFWIDAHKLFAEELGKKI